MPKPRQLFDDPTTYWHLITATNDEAFESQTTDRKEAGHPDASGRCSQSQLKNVQDAIQHTVSAFANSNRDGGLLVLGVSKTGEVTGIDHLTDDQRTALAGIDHYLVNQAVQIKNHESMDSLGQARTVLLIYVPFTDGAICETREAPPRAWVRQDAQNIAMSDSQRERLRRDKRVVDFERARCCPFDFSDLDQTVLKEFRESYLDNAEHHLTDEELLYHIGAIDREESWYVFTNAGLLFFAANPQRVLASAYVRLLRFEVNVEQFKDPGLPTFERSFSGPLTKQIRDVRSFFQQSGFFKTYPRRNPEGGFTDEPEYPYIAIDEAIVNAVVHRDFAVKLPIECLSYRDAFVVRNAGRVLQRNIEMRNRFSLSDTVLNSMPRNSKLIEWLKVMRDRQGTMFVRA